MSTLFLFSGDNKTEKAARSAQVALVDNGDMTDTLGFIEGRLFLITKFAMLSAFGENAAWFRSRKGQVNVLESRGAI